VPQLGDEVYFFFQGYEELVMKYYDCFNPKISQMVDKFKLIDFDDNKFLRRNPECVIRRINYLFPLKSRDRVDRLHEQRSRHNLLAVLQL
jgi:DNA primase large subunit